MADNKTEEKTVEAEETAQENPQVSAPEQPAAEQQDTAVCMEKEPVDTTPEKPAEDAAKQAADDTAKQLADTKEQMLRLAAEYANYRKRTTKEKENIWNEAKAQTVKAILPVYDNLERALKQATTDEAYAKGVEMTMKGLQDALNGLGVEKIPAQGETFDPKYHNAVMHVENENFGENTVAEVFQQGFQLGDKVIRFALVKVAN